MDSLTDAYINFVRISLAVAIIKHKPQDKADGSSYALELQQQVLHKQRDWKQEYYKIKNELMKLKQNQVLQDLHANVRTDVVGTLTPPQTQESCQQLETVGLLTSGPHSMEQSSPGHPSEDIFDSPTVCGRLSSHHIFLSKIASLKELTTGSLVICNSAAVHVVIDTFLECLVTVRESFFLAEQNNSKTMNSAEEGEMVEMRRELIRCMVELISISAELSRCNRVLTDLELFYESCVLAILSPPPQSTILQTRNLQSEIVRVLKIFARHSSSSVYICKFIMKVMVKLSQTMVAANFKAFIQDATLLNQVENIPKVTRLLLALTQERNRDSDEVTPILPLLDVMNIRADLDKTLCRYPLYTIHIREVLSKTGHRLPTDHAATLYDSE